MHRRSESDSQNEELKALVKRTNVEKPAAEEVKALRHALERNPVVWRTVGDLNRFARRMALQKVTPLMRESAFKQMEAMEMRLGYADSPEIERLLIEQIATCWLQMHLAEMVYGPTALAEPGLESATVIEKRLSGAHRRYMKSVETLARVRRLLRPEAVQVNIGGQQVNLVGGSGGGRPEVRGRRSEADEQEGEE